MHRGVARGGPGGHSPPNRLLSVFTKKNWLGWNIKKHCSVYQKCSVGLKYVKNALVAGVLPDPLVGWGGGHPLHRRLDCRAFCALHSVAPNVKSCLRS